MGFRKLLVCLLPLLVGAAHAQDERKVVSPDRQLEFRLFTTVPEGAQLNSIAYQVWLRGKLQIDTSCLGLNIHFQEPFLGENVGLSSSLPVHEAEYNGLVADYLQTSSTGRRIFPAGCSNFTTRFLPGWKPNCAPWILSGRWALTPWSIAMLAAACV